MTGRRRFLRLTSAAAASVAFGSSAESSVGLIFPSASRPAPPEAMALYPRVRFLVEGMGLGRTLPEDFDRLIDHLIPAAKKLAQDGARSVVLMAPPLSFFRSARFNQRISDAMTKATGLPSTTASAAIAVGLKAVRARRLAVATVYTEEISLHLQNFLEQSGFEVVTVKGLGIETFEARAPITDSVTSEEFQEFCFQLRDSRPETDAMLIASGYLPTLDSIVPIEKRCQIPVVNATPHALRAGVKLAGLDGRAAGFGALLEQT